MTVAIALVCKDGVLVAADSMGSNAQMIATRATKVYTFDHAPVIWTASGAVYVVEEVKAAIELFERNNRGAGGEPIAAFTQPQVSAIRQKLYATIHPKMKKCYGNALCTTPPPPGHLLQSFATGFLIAGYANGTPWLLEFAQDGQINDHTANRFYAVGSGGHFAQVASASWRTTSTMI